MYNLTFTNTSNNIVQMTTGVIVESNYAFSLIVLLVLWVVIFISTKQFDTKVGLFVSSFSCMLVGVFMIILEWLLIEHIIILLVMTMFSLIALLFSKR